MEKRYAGLRLAGTVYKVLGIIVGIITILGALGICLTSVLGGAAMNSLAGELGSNASMMGSLGGVVGGLIGGLLALIYGSAMALGLYAFGEMMQLMVAMEENTRATAAMLSQRHEAPPVAGVPQV